MKQVLPVIALAALLCSALTAGDNVRREPFDCGEYVFNIYLHAGNRPVGVFKGKIVYDLSERKWYDDMFGELSAVGINAMTYHSAYRPEGALYPHDNPNLEHSPIWKGKNPVKDFLESCQAHGIAGYLGVYLSKKASPGLAAEVIRDLVKRFSTYPAFKGISPPIEASATHGIDDSKYIELCRLVKRLDPKLKVMDYPYGPLYKVTLTSLIRRAASRAMDIENVQFYVTSKQFTGLHEARGMALLILGACPEVATIIHTHYMFAPPKQWIPEDRSYDVSQGAVLTATPFGTSIWSFVHGFWGAQHLVEPKSALWRRVKWYEGLLSVQRMLPYYSHAENAARIGILIPAHPGCPTVDIIRAGWNPLASAHVPARFVVDRRNLEGCEVLVSPYFTNCSAEQAAMVQEFVAGGGVLVVRASSKKGEELPENLSPRARRILLGDYDATVMLGKLDKRFISAVNLDSTACITPPDGIETRRYRKGKVILMPAESAEDKLAETVAPLLGKHLQVENLPADFLVEWWRKRGRERHDVILFYGTKESCSARAVKLSIPMDKRPRFACLVSGEGCKTLNADFSAGTLKVVVPAIGNEFAALILSNGTFAVLMPEKRKITCRAGETVQVKCGLVNIFDATIEGTLTVEAPRGWQVQGRRDFSYSIEPGEERTFETEVVVPGDVEKRPYFVKFETLGLVQRTMIFPHDGKPQKITDLTEPPVRIKPKRVGKATAPPTRRIGTKPLSVTAGELTDQDMAAHNPGICFLPGPEWDPPAEYKGKIARYGEVIPRLGGPNLSVNGPAPDADYVITLTYVAPKGGKVEAYDGKEYNTLGELKPGNAWRTDSYKLPHAMFAGEEADRSSLPGKQVLLQITAPAVYVHEARVNR